MIDSLAVAARRHRNHLVRWAVIASLAILLAALGYAAVKVDPFLALAITVVPLGLFALLKRIELGLIGMMLTAVFLRFRIPTGTASEVVLSLVVCAGILALWVSKMLVTDKKFTLKSCPANTPLLAFMVTVFVSLAWSYAFRDVLVHQAGSPFVLVASAVVMALLPGTFLLVANLVRDVRWLHIMVGLFLAQGLVTLAVTLPIDLELSFSETLRQLVFRNPIVWVNTQGLFSMWHVSIALSLAIFNRKLAGGWRAVLLVYTAAWFYWGFFLRLSWLAGWVPAFVAVAVIVFFRSRELFIPLLIVMIVAAGGFYLRTSFEAEAEESGFTRLAAYEVNWRVTSQHLIFGTGPGGYASYYMSYFPTEAMASHSNYIDIIAQTGIVGSFFIVWFFFAQARGGYRLRRELEGRGDFAESLTIAVLGGTAGCIVAMGLGDWLFPFAYTQSIAGFDAAMFNWFFMGSLWAVRHTLSPAGDGPSLVDGAAA
ncbi:MAG: O-antigen ligase family protein [Chloroflexota bacterium]